MKRVSATNPQSMVVQPAFIVGTYNADGTANFAPITWISVTSDADDFLLIASMSGSKKTKDNIAANGKFSANLVSVDMIELLDYFGSRSGNIEAKNALKYEYENGTALNVPTLTQSRWVYECEIRQIVKTGDSCTYFCDIRNTQVPELYANSGNFDIDLIGLDPIVYSGTYHSIGKNLGKIGDFYR
jgi:flavin reductase (DIM6/NTAB) family NADH-FMN oxidoreductase RutF